MTAYIKGNIVEGSLEEIAKLLGINLDDSSRATTVTNTDSIPAPSCPPVIDLDDTKNKILAQVRNVTK